MTTDKISKVTGTGAPLKSTSSSKKVSAPSTVSLAASETTKAPKDSNTAIHKKTMSNGYDHDGMVPEQNAGTTNTSNGGSVVNDLMKVYQNMTQSSTPQGPPAAAAAKYHIPPPMFNVPPPAAAGRPDTVHAQHSYQIEPSRQASIKQDESLPPSIPSSIQMRGSESSTMLHNEESDDHSSSKRKRRGSQTSNTSTSAPKAKKKSKQDGRWSKRFTWPEDLHRDFVSAIFDVGLKQSSPSTILEQMPKHEQITAERVKSHLQKYRLHRAKSKKEFISTYEASLRKLQSQGGVNSSNSLAGGEVAAHLTYSDSVDSGGRPTAPMGMGSSIDPMGAAQMSRPAPMMNGAMHPSQEDTETLMLPELTEAEKQSPIGSAMGYLMGLFFSLRQQLMMQRSLENGQGGTAAPVPNNGAEFHMPDMFGAFAGGNVAAAAAANPAPAVATPTSALTAPEVSVDGVPHQQAIPSMRTNIEENSFMKREMQNQMALQNKMRALKQQELAKYKNSDHGDAGKVPPSHPHNGGSNDAYAAKNAGTHVTSDQNMNHGQGSGELGGNDVSDAATNHHRGAHGLSFGSPSDLWNSDVVDDQLFEFLMND